MENKKVTVLMSTYNGEKFLEEQLDSIFAQKGVDLYLVVRDDGSKDGTVSILHDYQKKKKNMIVIEDGSNLGPCKSFLKLIRENVDSDYFALADQDDIWDEDKLEVAINMIKNDDISLYFSNLRIVDAENNYIRNSHDFPQLTNNKFAFLSVPLPTGCTIVYSRGLANIVAEAALDDYSMHDTWLYGVCSLFGKVFYDFEPHICYRVHGNNVVGALNNNRGIIGVKREIKYMLNRTSRYRSRNAEVLLEKFSEVLDEEKRNKLKKMVNYRSSLGNTIGLFLDKDYYPN